MDAEAYFYAWAFSQKITQLDLSAVRFESLKGSFKMQCIGIHSKLCVSVYVSKRLWLNVQVAEGRLGSDLWHIGKQTDRS